MLALPFGEGLVIRSWKAADLDSLCLYADNPAIAAFLRDGFPHPYTSQDAVLFLERAAMFSPPRLLALDYQGQAIGSLGIFPQDDVYRLNAEIGYWLAEPFWNRGILSAALPVFAHYGFGNFGVDRLFARTFSNNLASRRVLEKSGFVLEAVIPACIIKQGLVLDEWLYGLRKSSMASSA